MNMNDYISHGESVENKWKTWTQKYKAYIVAAIVCIVVFAGLALYHECNKSTDTPPPITTVPAATPQTLQQYFPQMTPADSKDLSHQITRAHDTQAPKYIYYTSTQAAADKQAQVYGKQQKADQIVKQTTTKEVKDETGKTTGQVIENDYYAVNLARKHDVKVGAAAVDGTAYATVSYRNRDVQYTGYYNPATHQGGAGVSVTVAEW